MTRLEKIFLKTGHIYVNRKGYVSIEVYSSDRMVCDYVARKIGGVVKRHLSIRKVIIHSRSDLITASQTLLEIVYDDKLEAQLQLVLKYARASNKNARDDAATELRKLLTEEKR